MATPQLAAQAMMAMFTASKRRGGVLSSQFKPIPGSTGSTAESITWDVKRFTQKIAGVITPGSGSNLNTVAKFSSKDIVPPEYGEAIAINAQDLIQRMAGENPFDAASRPYTTRFISMANEGLVEMAALIDRSMELQASQVLQTGILTLPGAVTYTADFKPKSSHFPTAAITWDNVSTCKPLLDLELLCIQIMTDSKRRVKRAFFGRQALREFLDSDQVKEASDLRRMDLIEIDPDLDERGASRYGVVTVGSYEIELWHYDDEFEPLTGGADIPYITTNKVILLPDNPALVVASTLVPQIVAPDPRVAQFVSVPTKSDLGWDLTPNVWTTAEGNTIYAGFRTRAVLIPQGIDEFGCLST